MPREITTHVVDGAALNLQIVEDQSGRYVLSGPSGAVAEIVFQKGDPRQECNGVGVRELLAVCIDRMQDYQRGARACPENAECIENMQRALAALKHRTINRIGRKVEGTQSP